MVHMRVVSLVEKHAKLMEKIHSDKSKIPEYVWKEIDEYCTELVIYYARYKCEGCPADDNLTVHHMVQRPNKDYMDFAKYAKARHNYKNQVLLCTVCHGKAELRIWNSDPVRRAKGGDGVRHVYTKERIAAIRRKFGE